MPRKRQVAAAMAQSAVVQLPTLDGCGWPLAVGSNPRRATLDENHLRTCVAIVSVRLRHVR